MFMLHLAYSTETVKLASCGCTVYFAWDLPNYFYFFFLLFPIFLFQLVLCKISSNSIFGQGGHFMDYRKYLDNKNSRKLSWPPKKSELPENCLDLQKSLNFHKNLEDIHVQPCLLPSWLTRMTCCIMYSDESSLPLIHAQSQPKPNIGQIFFLSKTNWAQFHSTA